MSQHPFQKDWEHLVEEPRPQRDRDIFTLGLPENRWHCIPALLGLPIERYPRPIKHPVLIMGMIGIFVAVHFLALATGLDTFVLKYGFIPEVWNRAFMATIFTSFFMHGGWLHLISNAYAFYLFGDDVEDDLGLAPFLFLIFGAHTAGFLAQWMFTSATSIPIVGASAGIFGVMGYYSVRFPKRHLSYMLFACVVWLHLPAAFAMVWRFMFEFIYAGFTFGNVGGGIAHFAHLGGAFFGIAFGLMRRRRLSEPS